MDICWRGSMGTRRTSTEARSTHVHIAALRSWLPPLSIAALRIDYLPTSCISLFAPSPSFTPENPKACAFPLSPPPKFQPSPPGVALSASSSLWSGGHWRSSAVQHQVRRIGDWCPFFARFHFPIIGLDLFPSRFGLIWSVCSRFLDLFIFSRWIVCSFVPKYWWAFLIPNCIGFFWCSPVSTSTSCGIFITQMKKHFSLEFYLCSDWSRLYVLRCHRERFVLPIFLYAWMEVWWVVQWIVFATKICSCFACPPIWCRKGLQRCNFRQVSVATVIS
jgi:hypothetical protein